MRVPCSSPHPPWDPTPRVDRWEEAVFLIVQENFEELSAVFSFYAQSIAGGSLQATTLLAVTLQDNELASFCRDTGLTLDSTPSWSMQRSCNVEHAEKLQRGCRVQSSRRPPRAPEEPQAAGDRRDFHGVANRG